MQRFKNILVVYNSIVGDEATLARATTVAKRNRARLTVTTVLQDLDAGVREMLVEERRQHLERLIASIRHDGIQAKATVLVGTPFLEITREVLHEGYDLVMMTAEGPLGLKKVLFGSTSMHLMRKCPCPIWVTRGQSKNYTEILAAVDPSEPTDEKDRLNRTILELASSLARLERSELHVVHTWELTGEDLVTSRSETTPDILDRLIRRNEAPRKKRLEALLAEHDLEGLPNQIHLLRGRPELAIPELARKKEIELIVMGTVCRTGVPGLLIGNTAETLLQLVDCSVLTVKPPGFVSPVMDDGGLPIRSRVT
jgi:nucleotide-binding universal stress UspA family protein